MVTWVAPGNPFGGPLRVATNDADELRRRGHQVEVVAAQPRRRQRGRWASADQGVHGYDAFRMIPGAGFSGLVSPRLLWMVWRRSRTFDVVHVHLARDLVSLPAAAITRLRRTALVVQCHGMIDQSSRRSAAVMDRLLTRRVLEAAGSVFVLTSRERADVEATFPGATMRFVVLPNGVPVVEGSDEVHGAATARVLFCSRLHARKRPVLFARMAVDLLAAGIDGEFAMVGADEGEMTAVRDVLGPASAGVELAGAIEPDGVRAELVRCDVLVLPSVDEPFPMIVLEALAVGRPVVVTETCGLAGFVRDNVCGIVVAADDLGALCDAVRRLIDDPHERHRMGAAGRAAVTEHLSMPTVASKLEDRYHAAADAARPTAEIRR